MIVFPPVGEVVVVGVVAAAGATDATLEGAVISGETGLAGDRAEDGADFNAEALCIVSGALTTLVVVEAPAVRVSASEAIPSEGVG